MSQISKTIAKQPTLEPAEDFYRLRREGIGFIEQMASRLWTDYNTHDPGITTLEALCYAITDLAYRIRWDIKDILTPQTASSDPLQPYPYQAFFTARKILTINPTTPDDFRRLLIDLPAIRNGWVFTKECGCDLSYYAWCDKEQLRLSYQAPVDPHPELKQVSPSGLYEVSLELEADPELGDLNERKVEYRSFFHDEEGAHSVILELRFPDMTLLNSDEWKQFLDIDLSFSLELTRLGATKTFNLFSDPSLTSDSARDSYLRNHWRNVLYLDFEINLIPSGKKLNIDNAALRIFSSSGQSFSSWLKEMGGTAGLKKWFKEEGAEIFTQRYRKKVIAAQAAVESAKELLNSHRNLDEDYCTVKVVGIEEVAVCADVEVVPGTDIEWVQARIWFEIERYFNPPIRFYTLQELLEADERVEEIFNGPELQNGFIKANDLEAASLKSVLRVSNIINLIMDIEGVIAVNQLQLTKYDDEGNAIKGAADPAWSSDGKSIFDTNKTSASWLLYISGQYQPRLYLNGSRFIFYKNGLPFRPRMDEATDTLNQLRGQADRPKNNSAANDLAIPKGSFRKPEEYYPVQYSFPLTYGIGAAGLPSHVSSLRRAQAKQLKAYLMVFEQLLSNALAQLAHTADLFSLDTEIKQSYFVKEITEALITGFGEIQNGISKGAVEAIAETLPEFRERRNRFLDHLLARFGEQFGEYALLLNNLDGKLTAQAKLINDKISFLNAYPWISHDRAKAFDYSRPAPFDYTTSNLEEQNNQSGIKQRINLLLGHPTLEFDWGVTDLGANKFRLKFQLVHQDKNIWLGYITLFAASEAEAKRQGHRAVLERMSLGENYKISKKAGKFALKLVGNVSEAHGDYLDLFDTKAEAEAMLNELVAWSASERMIVVEHLLLRPKFPGDALYPVCSEGGCNTCGDEDPYSFRLTFVMPGWTALYTGNLEMRRFADRTIQQETPSHLLGKTCWVGNEGFAENPCDEVVCELSELLITNGVTADGTAPKESDACACALAIYHAFSATFKEWYEEKVLDVIPPDTLKNLIKAQFSSALKPSDIDCSTILDASLWDTVQSTMLDHFVKMALSGWQFERFEEAWFQWLSVNAKFDWSEERLHERVEAILKANMLSSSVQEADICQCVSTILTQYGTKFYQWMESNLNQAFGDLPAFVPDPVTLCAGMNFKPGTAEAIGALLKECYDSYKEVSYRLWTVVNLLSKLRNVYPGATLHDCDDGSDQNPVRLDNTALGNYLLRPSIT